MAAGVGQPVERRIGRRVVRLARRAEDRRDRREEHEAFHVERASTRSRAWLRCRFTRAFSLGSGTRGPVRSACRGLRHEPVVEYTGRMDQRPVMVGKSVGQRAQSRLGSDSALANVALAGAAPHGPRSTRSLSDREKRRLLHRFARREHQRHAPWRLHRVSHSASRSLPSEPRPPVTSHPPSPRISGRCRLLVVAQCIVPLSILPPSIGEPGGDVRDDHLADVLPLRHVAERLRQTWSVVQPW